MAKVRSYYPRPAFACIAVVAMHAAATTSNVQRKAGLNALMLEPPWRLIPSKVNRLGARAGTKSVSTPSNVIADALLAPSICMLVRTTRTVHPSPSYHPINRFQERTKTQRQPKASPPHHFYLPNTFTTYY